MTFDGVFVGFYNGKKIRRSSWRPDISIKLNLSVDRLIKNYIDDKGNYCSGYYDLTPQDLSSNNWELVNE